MGHHLIIGFSNGRFHISGRGENYRTLSNCEPTTPALIDLLKRAEYNPDIDTIEDSSTLDFQPEDRYRLILKNALAAIQTERTNYKTSVDFYLRGHSMQTNNKGLINTIRGGGEKGMRPEDFQTAEWQWVSSHPDYISALSEQVEAQEHIVPFDPDPLAFFDALQTHKERRATVDSAIRRLENRLKEAFRTGVTG